VIAEALQRISREYAEATRQPYAGHPLAHYIRHDVPALFPQHFPQFPHLIWHASPGIGLWADAPWIGVFDPIVTESAQNGYYPVYLFSRSLDRVYLSLNQGMAQLRQEFGDNQTKEILSHRATILRNRLAGLYEDSFPTKEIDLQPTGAHTRLAMYEPGHAFGLMYELATIPPTDRLVEHATRMLELYELATARGGTSEFDIGQPSPDPLQPDLGNMTLDEIRRYRYHRSIERNPRLAREVKRIHGYSCQVCGFNFELTYGPLGREYIEAHHLTPLAQLPPGVPVQLSPRDDFAVVCANCHRMIHRTGAPPSFDEFRRISARG